MGNEPNSEQMHVENYGQKFKAYFSETVLCAVILDNFVIEYSTVSYSEAALEIKLLKIKIIILSKNLEYST